MPLTTVQTKTAQTTTDAASLSAVLDSTPTQGNLLLCAATGGSTMSLTGWSLATSDVHSVGLYLWSKIAGASEPTTVTVEADGTVAIAMWVRELSSNASSNIVDKTASSSESSPTSVSSGATGETTQADELAVAAFGYLIDEPPSATGVSYTNGFTEIHESTGRGNVSVPPNVELVVATKDLSATGAQTTTMTISASRGGIKSGLIATFKAFVAPLLDFSTRLSGGSGNANPAASIGGTESSSHYTGTVTAGGLFDDSAFSEYNASGHIDYRCVYIHNDDVSGGTAVAYISQQLPAGMEIAIGAATQAAGSTVAAIANDATAPSGVTFSTATNAGTGVNLGTIGAGQGKGLWIRRTIPAGATPASGNAWEISYEIALL